MRPNASRIGSHLQAADLRGIGRLAIDATLGLTDLVENLHHNILRVPSPLGTPSEQPTTGLTGFVYRSIRGVTRLVGSSVDVLLGQISALLGPAQSSPSMEREAVLSAINGVLGDHLAASGNPLAIHMHLRHDRQPIAIDRAVLAERIAQPSGRVLVLLHGLCMNPLQWKCYGEHDHGAVLAAEGGFTPLYLQYNSGLHIVDNGRQFAEQMQALHDAWPVPVEEIVLLCHSMGGLVARSACDQAAPRGDAWITRLTKIAFLGTPHLGARLERGGHWIDVLLGASPYTAAFARLGRLRSAGITDLRHGSVRRHDRPDVRAKQVPLPAGVACYALAGALSDEPGGLRDKLFGDGLVTVDSALGRHRLKSHRLDFPPEHQWVGQGIDHLALLGREEVMVQLRQWLLPR